MSVPFRGALLVAAASVVTGLAAGPGAAWAAGPPSALSAAEMSTALKAVSAASSRAAAKGWKASVKISGGSISGSESFVADPVHRVAYQRLAFGGQVTALYVAGGRGTYTALTDRTSRAAVKMMHRPAVRYVFTADRSAALDTDGLSPATVLSDDVDHAGTRTVHDDGSADYRLTQDDAKLTVHVNPAGVLTSADADSDAVHAVMAFAYGPEHVTLPAASATVSATTLAHGLAYLDMATSVRQVAGAAATDALRHRLTVSSLRAVARQDATTFDAAVGIKMIKTASVRGGVRVYATNPWTHRTVSYTLTASGRKVGIAQR